MTAPLEPELPDLPRPQPTRELLLAQALDACIQAERRIPGSAHEIIARQPAWARDDLRRLVNLAGSLDAAATNAVMSDEFRRSTRARLMNRIGGTDSSAAAEPPRSVPAGWRLRAVPSIGGPTEPGRGVLRWLWRGAAGLVAAVLGVTATLTASASALPGEPLYSVKQAEEELGLRLAADDQSRALALLRRGDARLDETARLLQQGRTAAAVQTTQRYNQEIERATTTYIITIDDALPDQPASSHIETTLAEQQAQLERILQSAPEPVRAELREALATNERGRALVADPRPVERALGRDSGAHTTVAAAVRAPAADALSDGLLPNRPSVEAIGPQPAPVEAIGPQPAPVEAIGPQPAAGDPGAPGGASVDPPAPRQALVDGAARRASQVADLVPAAPPATETTTPEVPTLAGPSDRHQGPAETATDPRGTARTVTTNPADIGSLRPPQTQRLGVLAGTGAIGSGAGGGDGDRGTTDGKPDSAPAAAPAPAATVALTGGDDGPGPATDHQPDPPTAPVQTRNDYNQAQPVVATQARGEDQTVSRPPRPRAAQPAPRPPARQPADDQTESGAVISRPVLPPPSSADRNGDASANGNGNAGGSGDGTASSNGSARRSASGNGEGSTSSNSNGNDNGSVSSNGSAKSNGSANSNGNGSGNGVTAAPAESRPRDTTPWPPVVGLRPTVAAPSPSTTAANQPAATRTAGAAEPTPPPPRLAITMTVNTTQPRLPAAQLAPQSAQASPLSAQSSSQSAPLSGQSARQSTPASARSAPQSGQSSPPSAQSSSQSALSVPPDRSTRTPAESLPPPTAQPLAAKPQSTPPAAPHTPTAVPANPPSQPNHQPTPPSSTAGQPPATHH